MVQVGCPHGHCQQLLAANSWTAYANLPVSRYFLVTTRLDVYSASLLSWPSSYWQCPRLPAHPRDGATLTDKILRASSLIEQAHAFTFEYRLGAAAHPQLGEQVMQVPLDGGLRQMHGLGNIAIRQASCHEA